MSIFREVTPLVEPLSLDEAFLDATAQVAGYGGPEALGRHLKHQVRAQTGLTLSVGIAANKLVAKIASDMQKPDGLVIVGAGRRSSVPRATERARPLGRRPQDRGCAERRRVHHRGPAGRRNPERLEAIFRHARPLVPRHGTRSRRLARRDRARTQVRRCRDHLPPRPDGRA